VGNYPEKIPAQQKRLKKKIVQEEPWEKNRASAFYNPGSVCDFKKILAQTIVYQKQSCTT